VIGILIFLSVTSMFLCSVWMDPRDVTHPCDWVTGINAERL